MNDVEEKPEEEVEVVPERAVVGGDANTMPLRWSWPPSQPAATRCRSCAREQSTVWAKLLSAPETHGNTLKVAIYYN